MRMHVFTYGSLMFEPVWMRVVGAEYSKVEALLRGYKRTKIKDETYPALIQASAFDCVRGMVYMNVDEKDVDKLDRFEGEYYRRTAAVCEAVDGKSIPASIYVFRPRFAHLVVAEPWDAVWFANEGIHQFLTEYKGFRSQYAGK